MSRISSTPAPPRPRLDVRDLELVLALAASGSTTRAASTLHVTQSAVSRGLLLAEDKLGVRLFDRGARGIVPTEAGERLIAGAGAILAQLAELERCAAAPEEPAKRIRVVCECYTAYRWLPSTLQNLSRAGSRLAVTLSPEHSDEPVAALRTGDVDVALLTTSEVTGPLRDEPLFADEIVFVVAPDHPLARRPSIGRRDLQRSTLITSTATPEAEARWFFTKVFGKRPPRLEMLRFPLTEAIMDAARAGLGVAAVSEWIASAYLASGDLVAKRFEGGPLRRPWRLAYRRETADAARRFAAAIAGAPPRIYAAAPARATPPFG